MTAGIVMGVLTTLSVLLWVYELLRLITLRFEQIKNLKDTQKTEVVLSNGNPYC